MHGGKVYQINANRDFIGFAFASLSHQMSNGEKKAQAQFYDLVYEGHVSFEDLSLGNYSFEKCGPYPLRHIYISDVIESKNIHRSTTQLCWLICPLRRPSMTTTLIPCSRRESSPSTRTTPSLGITTVCSNNLTTSLPTLRTHSASAAQCERKAAYMNKIVIKIGDASRN